MQIERGMWRDDAAGPASRWVAGGGAPGGAACSRGGCGGAGGFYVRGRHVRPIGRQAGETIDGSVLTRHGAIKRYRPSNLTAYPRAHPGYRPPY